jgi:hypothetical protein
VIRRDLEAIALNISACALRARMLAERDLERDLLQVMEDLGAAMGVLAPDVPRNAQLIAALLSAATRAETGGDITLGGDIRRAAVDLRVWYRLDDRA